MSHPVPNDALADERTPFIRNAWYVACYSEDVPAGKPFGRKPAGRERRLLSQVGWHRRRHAGSLSAPLIPPSPRVAWRATRLSAAITASVTIRRDAASSYRHKHRRRVLCRCPPSRSLRPRRRLDLDGRSGNRGAHAFAAGALDAQRVWLGHLAQLSQCEGQLRVSHENLLDLSHLSYLHADTFGTPDYAAAPFETELGPDTITVRRTVQPTRLPPVYANPLNMQGVAAARIVTSTYWTPGLSISAVVLRNLEEPAEQRTDHHIRTAQLVTPCDPTSVHYHFIVARDFAVEDQEASAFILKGIRAASQRTCLRWKASRASAARIRTRTSSKNRSRATRPASCCGDA